MHSISDLKYIVTEKVSTTFRDGSNYDYYFIIKKLAEQFEKQSNFLTENTARIDKNWEEFTKKIS